jgi:capsular polysaccharide biosynthesis protein
MAKNLNNQALTVSQKIFERLLLAYPKAHRAEYGPAMAQLFRDQCRDAWSESQRWGVMKLWLRVLPDLVNTSIAERLSALNERKSMSEKLASLFRFRQATPLSTFFAVFVVVFLLVLMASVTITFILPESYASTTRLKVEPEGNDILATYMQPASAQPYDPYFLQTTFEIIQSQLVLNPVMDKLNLNAVWGKKYFNGEILKSAKTMELLKQRMVLNTVRNTRLISITVYSDDKNEAPQIANAIAESYRDYRSQSQSEVKAKGIDALQNQYQEQEGQIRQAETELGSLRRQFKIANDASVSQSPQEQPYWDKKRDLDQLVDFHKLLAAKIEAEKLEAKIPKALPVEIIDPAAPGLMPVRPNKPLNITLGAIAGIFLASIAGTISAFVAFPNRK